VNAINLAEGKARFSELVARAEAGEEIVVSRRGKPIVKLIAVEQPRKSFDMGALRRLTASMKGPAVDSAAFIRELREGDRY
jgi:prevent-host-death family protein